MTKKFLRLVWPLAAVAGLLIGTGCSDTTTDTKDDTGEDVAVDTDSGESDTGIVDETDTGEGSDTGINNEIPQILEDGLSDLETSQAVTLPIEITGAVDAPVRAGSDFLPDFDSFKFSATAGEVLTIDVDTTGGRLTPITLLHFHDQDGNVIYERIGGYVQSGDGQIWREAFLPYTGDYTLYISDVAHFTQGAPVGGFNYHYVLTLTTGELNTSSATLPIDEAGTIANKGEVKAWKFTAGEDADSEILRAAVSAYRLSEGSALDTTLVLFDNTDSEVTAENDDFSSNHTDSRFDTGLTVGHEYLLVLDSIIFTMLGDANYHVTAGYMDLSDEREPNDSYEDAAVITVPTESITGTIGTPVVIDGETYGDVDVFKFSAVTGDFFTFRVVPGEGAPTDPFVAIGTLYDTWFGPQFVTSHLNNDSDGVASRVDFLATADGEYYMLVLDSVNMNAETAEELVGGNDYTYILSAEVAELEVDDLGALPADAMDEVLNPGGTCNYYTFDATGGLLLNLDVTVAGSEGETGDDTDGGIGDEGDGGMEDTDGEVVDSGISDEEDTGVVVEDDGPSFEPYVVLYEAETYTVLAGGSPENITGIMTTASQYLVAVCDNYGAGGADYIYDLAITENPLPQGSKCADPLSLTLPVAGDQLVINGDSSDSADTYAGLCGINYGSAGNDVVYSFQVEEDTTVAVSLVSDAFDTILYLRNTCADNSEIGLTDEPFCNDDVSESNYNSAISDTLSAGTWYLHVDGVFNESGEYTLTISVPADTEG